MPGQDKTNQHIPEERHERPEPTLERIRPYYEAYRRSKLEKITTQKDLAESADLREADFSAVFGFLKRNGRDKEGNPLPEPRPIQIKKVFDCLYDHWEIDNNYLVKKGSKARAVVPAMSFKNESPLTIHRNYYEAKIGAAVKNDGPEVWLLNTYVASEMLEIEASESDERTIKNWLFKQNKKVKILILRPDGKGMMLRTKSQLNINGSELANLLLRQLSDLLGYQKRLPEGQLEIKLMDEIPGVAAVILENCLFYGHHYSYGHTESSSWFEITDPSHFSYQDIKKHFEAIWNDDTRSFVLNEEILADVTRALNIVRRELDFLVNSKWRVHLHDLSDVIKGEKEAPYGATTGNIIHWQLEITKPERGVYLRAQLTVPGLSKPLKANVVSEKIGERNYAHIRFPEFGRISIHLSFHGTQEEIQKGLLLGHFVISSGSDSCSGYIILQRALSFEETAPALPVYLHRILTFRDSSYYSLARTRSEMMKFKSFPHAGTYKVYSYGGKKGGSKNIKINWLHIDEFGVARYKNQNFTDLIGRVTHIMHNLHIVFTHFRDKEAQRRSYMIISVHSLEPEEGRYYCAVHLGVSWDKHMPTGKRFIMEYFGKDGFEDAQPAIISLHSPEYKAIKPKELRYLLSGRVKNLLGFLREEGQIFDAEDIKNEWKGSICMNEVFYDSAVQNARRGKYDQAAKMILRAVNHGRDRIDDFEQEVNAFAPEAMAKIKSEEDYKKVQEILGL
ncbi:MAG: hypothetical protein OHK0019_06590 [Saprospiraceae bacterium]